MFKEKIRDLIYRLVPKEENVRPLIAGVVISTALLMGYHFLGSHLTIALWIVTAILLAVLLLIIIAVAGFIVLKALVLVATELSLLIFLAQSYCDVPNRSASSGEALKSLLAVGLVYVVISFIFSLHKVLKEDFKGIKDEKWSKDKIAIVVLALVFAGLFIWEIYLVVRPIVQNLCVFK